MLRRGFDMFLKYANYGTPTLKIHLPTGLPFVSSVSNFCSRKIRADHSVGLTGCEFRKNWTLVRYMGVSASADKNPT